MALVANQKNPRDAWAIHALAHALYEMAAFDTGITRLPPAVEPCTHLGWFRNHLLWHLALMHMGRGEYDAASELGRTVFEGTPSSIPGDLHDSISLLWRLELLGRDVGDRGTPFARIAGERLDRQALLFHAAHLAVALAARGHTEFSRARLRLGSPLGACALRCSSPVRSPASGPRWHPCSPSRSSSHTILTSS